MSAKDIVSVAVSLLAPIVSRAGFKTPLVLSGEANGIFDAIEYTRSYRDPDALLTDGFSPLGATYRVAQKWFSQVPNGGRLKVGKRTTSAGFTTTLSFTLGAGAVGDEFWIEINGTTYTSTVGTGEDEDDAAADLAGQIDAESEYVAAETLNVIDFTMAATDDVPFVRFSENISLQDGTTTTGATTVADLATIRTKDPDWYALFSDVQSASEVAKISPWAEGQVVHFGVTTADADVIATAYSAGVTTDVMSANRAGAYANTMIDFGWFGDMGIVGIYSSQLAETIGTTNWAHKVIKGRTPREISDAAQDNIESKFGNYYVTANGAATFLFGQVGDGEFVDTINLIHETRARVAEGLIAKLRAEKRVPFTQKGINSLASIVLGYLSSKLGAGLSDEVFPVVTPPNVADIPAAQRRTRVLSSDYPITFSALLEGAINQATVEGKYTYDSTAFEQVG